MTALAALAAAAFATSAHAQVTQGGHADVFYGQSNIDVDGGDTDVDVFGIRGSYSFPVGETLGLQLNGSLTEADGDDVVVDESTTIEFEGTTVIGEAHLMAFNPDSNYFGGYVALGDVEDFSFYGGGVQGGVFFENATLEALAGIYDGDDLDDTVYGIGGNATFFPQPNLLVEGRLAFTDFGDGGDIFTLGGEIEYKLNNPISFFGQLEYQDADDFEVTTYLAGVRFTSYDTLFDRNRGSSWLPGTEDLFGGFINVAGAAFGAIDDVVDTTPAP